MFGAFAVYTEKQEFFALTPFKGHIFMQWSSLEFLTDIKMGTALFGFISIRFSFGARWPIYFFRVEFKKKL